MGVTHSGASLGCCPAEFPVATTGRDTSQFLDVDVEQFATPAGLYAADHPPGGAIHPLETVDAVTHQYPVDRRRRHVDDARQACRTQHAGLSKGHDAPLNSRRRLMWTRIRTARPIHQPCLSTIAEPTPPLVRRLT